MIGAPFAHSVLVRVCCVFFLSVQTIVCSTWTCRSRCRASISRSDRLRSWRASRTFAIVMHTDETMTRSGARSSRSYRCRWRPSSTIDSRNRVSDNHLLGTRCMATRHQCSWHSSLLIGPCSSLRRPCAPAAGPEECRPLPAADRPTRDTLGRARATHEGCLQTNQNNFRLIERARVCAVPASHWLSSLGFLRAHFLWRNGIRLIGRRATRTLQRGAARELAACVHRPFASAVVDRCGGERVRPPPTWCTQLPAAERNCRDQRARERRRAEEEDAERASRATSGSVPDACWRACSSAGVRVAHEDCRVVCLRQALLPPFAAFQRPQR